MILNTVGFQAPPDFPTDTYNRIHACLTKKYEESHKTQRQLRGMGWNGLAYRYRAMAEYDKEFTDSVSLSNSPPPDERYKQGNALFGFFTTAVSVMDCFFFSSYCIASILKPDEFPVSSVEELRYLYPLNVREKFTKYFPGEKITDTMALVLNKPLYTQLKDMRDVLSHRGTLPRQFNEGGERSGTATIPSNPKYPSNQWQCDFFIDTQTTATYRQWVSKTVIELVEALDEFCNIHFVC